MLDRLVVALDRHIMSGCPGRAPELAPLEDRGSVPEVLLDGAAMAGLVARLGRIGEGGALGLDGDGVSGIAMGLEGLARLALAMERRGVAIGVRRLG